MAQKRGGAPARRGYTGPVTVQTQIRRLARGAISTLRRERVSHEGMILPGRHLRFGGRHFQQNEAFASSARKEAMRLVTSFGLNLDSSLLEIGCGPGRLPIGILDRVGDIRRYQGLDVSRTPIEWCQKNITCHHPSFVFTHVDVQNDRYNKSGTLTQEELRLPADDASVDIVYLYSVFSHLRAPDVGAYLREFRRVLKKNGHVFLTAFVEDNVPEEEENPAHYGPMEWRGALHCVRFSSVFFRGMIAASGFRIDREEHGAETDGQTGFYLSVAA